MASLPLLPSGPGGVQRFLLHRARPLVRIHWRCIQSRANPSQSAIPCFQRKIQGKSPWLNLHWYAHYAESHILRGFSNTSRSLCTPENREFTGKWQTVTNPLSEAHFGTLNDQNAEIKLHRSNVLPPN